MPLRARVTSTSICCIEPRKLVSLELPPSLRPSLPSLLLFTLAAGQGVQHLYIATLRLFGSAVCFFKIRSASLRTYFVEK